MRYIKTQYAQADSVFIEAATAKDANGPLFADISHRSENARL